MGLRKYLSKDGLIAVVRHGIRRLRLVELARSEYSWEDCIMSGLAVFGFKFPSLLKFDRDKTADSFIRRNLRTLFGVKKAPCDTTMRERLDAISAKQLRLPFKQIFAHLQPEKVLEKFRYLDGHYIVSIDGTGQYCSKTVHCDNCCEKNHRDGGTTYYHQMLGAVLVHPEHKEVIPLAPEPIVNGDGATKNDCERNASKRLLLDLRREHPHLKLLIVEDGLASNFPHLSLIDSLNMNYIISVKPGDHAYLFEWICDLKPLTHSMKGENGTRHEFSYYKNVPLNDANYNYRVNVLVYKEISKSGKVQNFSWVTKIDISNENVYEIMRAGRCRWRIENETFNTLKNQGYNFEHNYGHGYQNLCSVMTMLMMLAFLIDQVQQLCCELYQKSRKKSGTLLTLFETVRTLIKYGVWDCWHSLYDFIANSSERSPPSENGWISR